MSATGNMVFQTLAAFSITGAMTLSAVDMMPENTITTSEFFEVHGITAKREGSTAIFKVNREIHQPITMSYTVRVMVDKGGRWHQSCFATASPFEYSPDAILPDPIKLDWWTNGDCTTLPEGRVQIWTTWTPQLYGLAPVSVVVDVE